MYTMGRSGVVRAGEFQRMTAGRRLRHSQSNVSRTDWVRFFEMRLRSSAADLDPDSEQMRFSVAQRHHGLCLGASPDARKGSLSIQQDVLVFSAILDPGQHVAYGLAQGRSAWLHVVEGKATVGEVELTTGDGVGVVAERAVSLTAWEETEILLVDLSTPSD
jgi:redox-sensitive bicupin YhaK (pirin superfamily)